MSDPDATRRLPIDPLDPSSSPASTQPMNIPIEPVDPMATTALRPKPSQAPSESRPTERFSVPPAQETQRFSVPASPTQQFNPRQELPPLDPTERRPPGFGEFTDAGAPQPWMSTTSDQESTPRRGGGILLFLGAGALVILLSGALTLWYLGRSRGEGKTGAPAPSEGTPTHPPLPAALQELKNRAERGDTAAQRQLGLSYAYGLGVKPDHALAIQWLQKAAQGGSEAAKKELEALSKP